MMTSMRCFARLSLLVILAASVAPGVWASGNIQSPTPNDSIEVGPEHEAANREYSSPAMVPAAAFHNDGGTPDSFFFSFGGGYWSTDAGTTACMYAPVYIPNGSTIQSFYANVKDNNATLNIYVYLYRSVQAYGTSGSSSEIIATVNSTGADTNIDSLYTGTISAGEVTEYYTIYVATCAPENTSLYNARVYYSQP